METEAIEAVSRCVHAFLRLDGEAALEEQRDRLNGLCIVIAAMMLDYNKRQRAFKERYLDPYKAYLSTEARERFASSFLEFPLDTAEYIPNPEETSDAAARARQNIIREAQIFRQYLLVLRIISVPVMVRSLWLSDDEDFRRLNRTVHNVAAIYDENHLRTLISYYTNNIQYTMAFDALCFNAEIPVQNSSEFVEVSLCSTHFTNGCSWSM